MALVCTLALGFAGGAARAEYPSQDIISLNISNNSDYTMAGDGETETLAGTLPDNAWQNTANADRTGVVHSGDARNGYRNGVAAWDGTSQSVTNLADVVFTWAVSGGGVANYGTNGDRTPVFQRAWLARLSSTSTDGEIVLQNIPYEKYDVIVYVSGKSTVTDVRAVRVNGLPYRWSSSNNAMESSDSAWGAMQNTPEIGKNALRIPGVTTPDLHIRMANATSYGISAVQIVRDMTAGNENGYQKATGKVISVNLQSAKNNTGYKTGNVGLESVPYDAWTQDGLSLADNNANYDRDVSVTVKEWDAEKQEVKTLSGVTLHEKVNNAYYFGSDYVPQPHILSGYADDSARPEITVTGVPYKKYDVIVYCATDMENRYFGPVTVNGTPYRWSASGGTTQQAEAETSTAATRWGYSQARVMSYGGNAIRVTGQTSSTLTIKGANNANSARGGIAGFQVVDTYDPDEIEGVTVEDGGTYAIEAALTDAVRLVCEGSLTIAGANDYTVVNDDLTKLDLDGVTGTVTLGANTLYTLGADRALPSGYVFGQGSSVALTETVAEYANDSLSVSGLTGVSTVVLTRLDGTTETLTVMDGAATRGDGTNVKVTGPAALYDFTFTNTFATAAGSRKSAELSHSTANWILDGDDNPVASSLTSCPWVSMKPEMANWNEFSTAVAGTMPSGTKTMFISFGSASNSGKTRYALFLATGAAENEVDVSYGNEGSSTVLTTMTVPNAATARHFYGFVVSDNRTKLTIYLDGMKWKTVTRAAGFQLGTSDHGGIQCGSAFGGLPNGYSGASNGDIYTLLVYDYLLSAAQIEKLKEMYPYTSPNGSYRRNVSGAVSFASAGAWTKAGDEENTYEAPADGAAAELTAAGDAVVTANASLKLESLTLGGEGSISFKKSAEGAIVNNGLTTIGTAVTNECGAVSISGGPTVIADGGSICFDCSALDLWQYVSETLIPLTGEIEERAEGIVTCILPAGYAAREHTAELVYASGSYQLRVAPRAGRDVYLPAGTTVFTDDTQVTWTEGEGDAAVVVTGYAIAGDTVHFSAADTVAVERSMAVAGYAFGDYAGTLTFAPESEELILNIPVTGAGKVVVSSGTVQSRGSFATNIDVAGGATLKLGAIGGFGATGNGASPSGKAITVQGTVELNGTEGCNAYTLAGGTLQNNGAAIGTGQRQTCALTLTADSTVHAGSDFGLIGNGYAATTLDLGGHTLTKTGDAKFWLYNTTVSGGGKIKIDAGSVYAHGSLSASGTAFEIAEGATLAARTDSFAVGALSGKGTVDLGLQRPSAPLAFAAGSELTLKVVLANSTEAQVRIPYTGKPKSVEVYESDWNNLCGVATVSYDGGSIVIDVEVANTTRANPAKDGDTATFTNVFRGTEDATWETLSDWYVASGNRWASYSGTIAPAKANSDQWAPVLVDGDFVKLTPGSDGYKEVAAQALEGWNLRLGLFNGVRVTVGSLTKVQSDSSGSWFMVDDSSQLVIAGRGNGNNGGNLSFYVAAKDGITFKTDFKFNQNGANTVYYSLAGDGSVMYENGVTTGTHIINRVKLPVGNPQSKLKKLITRKLVSFGSKVEGNVAFDLSQATVTSLDETLTMTAFTPSEENPALTTDADFGTYQLTQTDDGVYITYVGYGVPFAIRLR
ncbi:MAG: hypothetical protein IJ173_05230 [Kiritimatiellae bacterium]|nr:hypothetical protein [Kiritimatiellia bacterium]